MITERIIITFNRDGSFRGASATDWSGQIAPITSEDISEVNLSLVAQYAELKTKVDNILIDVSAAVVANDIVAMKTIANEVLKPDVQRKKEAAEANIAAAEEALIEARALLAYIIAPPAPEPPPAREP